MNIDEIKNESKENFLLGTTGSVDMIIYNINDKDFYIVNICTETGDSTVISITKYFSISKKLIKILQTVIFLYLNFY